MYIKRSKYSRKLKKMREAKERKRLNNDLPEYPHELPELRRQIIIKDYDFGEVVHQVDCFKSNRIDCYRVEVDGKVWRDKVGWSKILEAVRKGFIRIGSNH